MVVTIIILAITASNAADFSGIGCSVPSKLAFNIAAVSIDFIQLTKNGMLISSLVGFVLPRTRCTPPLDQPKAQPAVATMVHLGPACAGCFHVHHLDCRCRCLKLQLS